MYVENYIKMDDLKDGYLYKIIARNASYGIWIASTKSFAISRTKFTSNYIFEEYHYDCEAYATAQPIEETEQSPFKSKDIVVELINKKGQKYYRYKNEDELLKYLNKFI